MLRIQNEDFAFFGSFFKHPPRILNYSKTRKHASRNIYKNQSDVIFLYNYDEEEEKGNLGLLPLI